MLHLAGILFPHISTRISWVCELLSRWRFKSSRTYKHCVIWAGHDFSNDPSVFFFQAILHQELFIILFVMDCVILKMTAAMITSNLGLQVFFYGLFRLYSAPIPWVCFAPASRGVWYYSDPDIVTVSVQRRSMLCTNMIKRMYKKRMLHFVYVRLN